MPSLARGLCCSCSNSRRQRAIGIAVRGLESSNLTVYRVAQTRELILLAPFEEEGVQRTFATSGRHPSLRYANMSRDAGLRSWSEIWSREVGIQMSVQASASRSGPPIIVTRLLATELAITGAPYLSQTMVGICVQAVARSP